MHKRLLLTVSEDDSALAGVRFVGGFFARREPLALTLLYTSPRPRAVWKEEEFFEAMAAYEQAMRECGRTARLALEQACSVLEELGFESCSADIRLRLPDDCSMRDILRAGGQGGHDAVVLGRRASGQLLELIREGVTDQIVDNSHEVPLWICNAPEVGRTGVLLCLDGSASSLNMATHVARMVVDEPQHGVGLLHVPARNILGRRTASGLRDEARAALVAAGLAEDRITDLTVSPRAAVSGILEQADGGRWAVVATGSPANGGLLRRLLHGSVVRGLLEELSGAVLWVGV